MNTICVTCLSSERHLIQLQHLFTNIWHGISLQMTDYICWECKAMFNNIWRFKQQVLTAQDVLRNQNLTEIPKVNQCLSKLTKSIKTSYDSEYYEDDVIKTEPPSVDYLDETIIKTEVHLTDDCSHTEPMKTEIDNTELNNSKEKVEIEIYSDSQENITNETEQPNVSAVQTQLEFNMYQPSNTEKQFIVNVMTEDELLKARESDRELTKYKNSTYKCEECIITFVSEETFNKHYVRHTAEWGEFLCKICNVHFTTNNNYKIHTIKHYISYQCKVCEFKSHRINEMTAHHSKVHEGPKTYHCHVCNTEFINVKRLIYHRNKEHSERTTCTICEKQFSSPTALNVHMLNHNSPQPGVKCEICKKPVKYIRKHMLTHRREADENAFCAECNVQFKNVAIYKVHLRKSSKHVARDKFPYICAECGRKFVHRSYLIYHLDAIHYNKKEFVCQICNKGFMKGDSLKRHMLYKHEGVSKPRKYICSYCDRGFTERSTLDNHIRIHTGEKPFECHLCDTKFRQKSALRTHVKGVHKKLYKK